MSNSLVTAPRRFAPSRRADRAATFTALALLIGLAAAPARAAVGPDGSFVHGFDIKIPAGTNGMAPKLSVSYNSRGGDGPFGVGWRLSGLPAIARASYGYGINYDGTDSYVAEGAGRLVRQSDGSFFPETWSGGKYVPYGTCGDGPCMWVLKSGSGIDMYFGGVSPSTPTTDHSSRIYRAGTSGSVRTWALARVINTRDQLWYDVAYDRDTAQGDYYPQTITYTAGPGLSSWKTITFQTEARSDVVATYPQGSLERWDRRVNLIRVNINGRKLREYAVSYEYGAATGRSRVRSVQERGGAGGSLPAQTFSWQEGVNAMAHERWMTAQPGKIGGGEQLNDAAWFEGDYNGDGRTDRCKVYSVGGWMTADCYLAQETGAFAYKRFCQGYDWSSTDPANGNSQWFTGDFNGDGKTDLARIWGGSAGQLNVGVHLSTGSGFTQETWTPSPGGPIYSTNAALGASQWFAADFNGDGRTDLGVVYASGVKMSSDVYLSTGGRPSSTAGGFVYRRWATDQGGWIGTNPGNQQWFAADFNGDGKADLAKIWNVGGMLSADVHVSSGTAFSMRRWATNQGGWITTDTSAGNSQWFAADFNGDGKTDLGKIWNENSTMNADVHLSSGADFVMQRWATAHPGWVPTTTQPNGYSQWFSGDFNGDGRTDLSRMWNCSTGGVCLDVYPAQSGAFGMQRWATNQGGWIPTHERQWFTGDFNGDGRTDLAKFFNDTGGLAGDVHRAGGNLEPDLISTLTNGVGGTTSVTYALSLPSWAIGSECGLEAAGGGWTHGGTSGNGKVCGIPNTAPRALVMATRFDNGRAGDPGRVKSTSHMYLNGRVQPSGFDDADYRARYPDVAQSSYGTMPFGMEQHYNDFGRAEGRLMRLRAADLGFERYDETEDQSYQTITTHFRQDAPFNGRPLRTYRFSGLDNAVTVEEKFAYSSWTPFFGVVGINDYKKNTWIYERGTVAHTSSQTKTLDTYGSMTRVVDDAGEGYSVTTDTAYAHDLGTWTLARILEAKKYRTSNQNVLEWERVRYNAQGRVDLKERWLCSNAASCTSTNGQWIPVASGHAYDAFGNLVSVKDARGITTATTYDSTYRALITKVTSDASGLAQARTMTYGLLNGTNVDTETDASGQQTKTTWDEFGRKISVESPLGGLERYAFVGYGTVGQQYDETQLTVDTRVVRKRSYFDGGARVFRVESTGDDGKTIVVESEDSWSAGVRRTAESRPHFTTEAPVWSRVTYDSAGRQLQATLFDGSVMSYSYGPGSASVTSTVSGKARTTTEYFTARGRMWKKVDALGGATVFTYDEMQRPTKVTYQGATQVTNVYDSFGQRRSTVEYSSGQGRTTSYTYDAAGNQTEAVDPRGHRVRFTYDNLGRVTLKQHKLSSESAYSTDATFRYDDPAVAFSKGRLTQIDDLSGSTRFTYDARGRVSNRTTSINGLSQAMTTSLSFDAIGRATQMIFPNGGVQKTSYTDAGNVKQVLYNGAEYASFSGHSATGRVGLKHTPRTDTTFTYDQKDLLASLVTTGAGGAQLQNDRYTYDEAGNVLSILDARASKVVSGVDTDVSQTFVYDQVNRIVKAQGRYGGVASSMRLFGYDGGAAGGATQPIGLGNATTFHGTVQRSFAYTGQQVTSGGGFAATYDAAGNMTTKTVDGVAWTYTFDHDNRLRQVKKGGVVRLDVAYNYQGERVKKVFYPGGGRTITTYYVPGGYEVRVDSASSYMLRTVHLSADASGKIASITTSGSSPIAALLTDEQHRALAGGSDPSSLKGLAGGAYHLVRAALPDGARVRPVVGATFATLAAWLLLAMAWRHYVRRAHQRRPRWASERRLSLAARAIIAPLLLSLAVTGSGCGVDRGGDLEATDSALLSGNTLYGVSMGTAFYHPSHIGSSAVITDVNGALTSQINYLPFGEVDQERSAGSDRVTHKFAGQELDEETGLIYQGARYYDPSIGRSLSADSIIPENGNNAQAFNRYAYVENNPVTYTDPTGHWSWKGFWRATGNVLASTGKFLFVVAVVVAIIAISVMTGGAVAAALGLAAGGFWAAVVGGAVSGFLISGALALRNGASFSDAMVAAFQGAIVGAIGGGVGQYVQGIGGVTKGLGEAVATGGARGLATSGASGFMRGERGSELLKSSLFGAASGVTCSTVVYGLDKLAQAYASDEGFGMGKPNTFGNAVSKENGGAHDVCKESQAGYLSKTGSMNNVFGGDEASEGFVEGGGLSRLGVSLGLNPTSQVHDGVQGVINTSWGSLAGTIANFLTMIPASVVANYGIVAQNYPEFFTTGPKYRVFNLE
jgi:RHS repeat-associated protein